MKREYIVEAKACEAILSVITDVKTCDHEGRKK